MLRLFPPATTLNGECIRLAKLGVVLAFAVAGAHVLAVLRGVHLSAFDYVLEVPLHFPWQALLLVVVLALYLSLQRLWRWALPLIVPAGVLVAVILVAQNSSVGVPATESTRFFRVASLNVHRLGGDGDAIMAALSAVDADVVVLIEVNEHWRQRGDSVLGPKYSHRVAQPREDNFGMAVYSRYELLDVQVRSFLADGPPSVLATVNHPDGFVRLIATHPVPPPTPSYWLNRTQQIQLVAEAAGDSALPVIVIGDFNLSPWTPVYRQFVRRSGLRNAAAAYGFPSTWGHAALVFQTPIDHCFISPHIRVGGFRTFLAPGSDHRGIAADLSLSSRNEKNDQQVARKAG